MTTTTGPGGKRTPARGRPSAYSPALGQRIAERLAAGETLTAICEAVGINRSTLFRWQCRDPDFCNTGDNTPAEHRATSHPEGAEVTHPAEAPDPAPNPPDSDADDQVVLVVRRTPKPPAPPAPTDAPVITAGDRERARIAANWARRPLGSWSREEAWGPYVGPDGFISPTPLGTWWGPI